MVSPQASDKLHANLAIQMFDHDPDGVAAAVVTPDGGTTEQYVDMRDFSTFSFSLMSSTLTGAGITLIEIVANDVADGTGNTVVIKTGAAVVADAVGDTVVLQCTAEEIQQEGSDAGFDLRFVAGRATVANAADEAVATYVRGQPRFAKADLTAEVIA